MPEKIKKRIENLLETPYERDWLVRFTLGPLERLPSNLVARDTLTLPSGRSFSLASGVSSPISHSQFRDEGVHVWILGSPVHQRVSKEGLADWVVQAIKRGETSRIAAVEGIFSVFVLDLRHETLHIVTDVLGLRPIFIRDTDDGVCLANRVGNAWDASTFRARVNMEAVRSWACFGFNATDGALLEGWRRLPAATHLQIRNGGSKESIYHQFDLEPQNTDVAEVTDQMIASVNRSLLAQTHGLSAYKLSLSGGFDSRLLAVIANRNQLSGLRVSVVNGSDNWRDRFAGESTESRIAKQVCQQLGVPINVIEFDGDWVDAYGEPYLLMSDGFPIGKQIISLVVESGSSSPVINGFLGDNLMRGSWDAVDGKTEDQFANDKLVPVMYRRHSQLPGYLFDKKLANGLADWAHAFLDRWMMPYYEVNRAFVMLDLQMRQRLYMSNNFLQHIDQCEPILPFATADLVQLKLSVGNGLLNLDTFRDAFDRHFPEVRGIPHSKEIAKRGSPRFRISTPSKRRRALQVLAALHDKEALRGFNRRVLLPRLAASVVDGRQEFVADTAMRFLLLEKVADHLGVSLDW